MEPSPPPESRSQRAASFPTDISVLSSSSTTTTAAGSASQTSKSRGKSRGGSRGGNKKRKGSEDAKDDPSDPDPLERLLLVCDALPAWSWSRMMTAR